MLLNVVIIFSVIAISFAIMHSVPGGPFDKEKALPDKIKANIEEKFNLNLPLSEQFFHYIKGASGGDLGPSYKYLGRSVSDIVGDAFPVSALLGLWAFFLSFFLGISAGIFSVWRVRGFSDYLVQVFSSCAVSFPSFVLAAFFVLVFSGYFRLLPPALWEGPEYVLLPAFTMAIGPAAYIARLFRGSIIEVYGSNYVVSARAKGMSEPRIFLKHVIPNSIMPVITVMGPLLASLVTGSFIVEEIFSIPGMGKFFVLAVTDRDYPLIMGITIVYAVILVSANFAVDLCYFLIEPRLRKEI